MAFPTGQSYAWNIEPVGYTDLDGKPAFKLAIHQVGERWYLYTATFWHPGWHIVDITDPADPRHIRFIEGPENTWTLQIQIADGKMITSYERIADSWGHDPAKPFGEGMQVWSLDDPDDPADARRIQDWRHRHPPQLLRWRPLRLRDRAARGL